MRRLPILAALVVSMAGCRTMAPPAPADVPRPEPPAPVVERPPGAPPVETPAEKDQRYRPVPPGVFESQSRFPQTGVTEWQLTNGARLVLRPMTTTPRHVALYAFAPGGFAAVPPELAGGALAAAAAPMEEAEGGTAVHASLTAREAVLRGMGTPEALGALFARLGEAMEGPPGEGRPHGLSAEEALYAAQTGLPPTAQRADRRDAQALYARLFDDPRRFTFVLVGDVSPAAVEAEAARLARLRPSRDALLAPPDTQGGPVRLPTRDERWTLPPDEAGAAFAVAFRGRVEPSFDNLAALDVLAALLEDAVGGEVRATAALYFDAGVGEIRVVAEGRGVAAPAFEAAFFDAVRALRAEPPPARTLAQAREGLRAAHEASLETTGGWLTWLGRLYRYDQDTREVLQYGRRLSGVAAERVNRLALAVLDPERYVLVRRPVE